MSRVFTAAPVGLIVATLGLKEVQLIRAAMRAADQQAGAGLGVPAATPEPRRVIHPEPRYEPRQVIHPTPRFEPRPIIHPRPRAEACRNDCACVPPPEVIVHQHPGELPLQPPWKTLPWQNPPQPAPMVKVARYHPDIIRKGQLLDFFI